VAGGRLSSGGSNLDSDGSCGFVESGDQNGSDPHLGPLAENGGWTQTHALLPGSPAIDAGGAVGCADRDQRGLARSQDGNSDGTAACDIGAFELQPAHPVSLAATEGPEGGPAPPHEGASGASSPSGDAEGNRGPGR
jgi:hypothetical protein